MSGTIYHDGLGAVPAAGLNAFVQVLPTVAALRNFTGQTSMAVLMLGTTSPNDGGQQVYYWNATSTASDNGTTVIAPTGLSTGRWLALTGLP